ncbi:MAG: hypothetical protein ACJ8HI_10490 [Massilia sp.]
MSKLIKSALAFSAMAVLLTACGGNNDGDNAGTNGGNNGIQSPPVLPPASTGVTVDVAAAWRQYLGTPRRWDISGNQGGSNFILSLVLTPGGQTTFPATGQVAQTTTESLRLSFAGLASANTDGTLFYTNDSLIGILGGSGANATCAVVRTPFSALPTSGAVGANGTVVSLDNLNGCSSTAQRVGSVTLNWSIEQDLAVTLFCLTTIRADAAGATAGSQTACVQSNAQGQLGSSARLTLRRPDGSVISGKNY